MSTLILTDKNGSLTYEVQMDATLATLVSETGDTAALLARVARMGYAGLRQEVVERNRDAQTAAEHAWLKLTPEQRAAAGDPYGDG